MRNFIYLDTDFLTSFMAQENDGLETTRNIESDTYVKNLSGTPTTTEKHYADLTGNVALLKSELSMEKSIESGLNVNVSSEVYKEMASRVLHDNMFNYFENYLNKNDSISVSNAEKDCVGKYIVTKGEYEFIDINSIEKMCEEKFLRALFDLASMQNPLNFVSNNKNQSSKRAELPKEMYALTKIGDKLSYVFKSLIPTNSVIKLKNMIIVINDNYLRETSKMIEFKYDGEINVVGIINRIYRSSEIGKKKSASPLTVALNSVNDSGIEFLKLLMDYNCNDIFIVTPIAIYF